MTISPSHNKAIPPSVLDPKPGQIGPIEMVGNGIFAAKARSAKGDLFYLGMEHVDMNQTRMAWKSYVYAMGMLNRPGGGMLCFLADHFDDTEGLEIARKAACFSNLTDHEFDEILKLFREKEVYIGGKRQNALAGISGGVAGFEQTTPTFIAYISKKAITGRVTFWNGPDKVPPNYKEISSVVAPIIMSVGVTLIENSPLFSNRGIFRNPISVLEGSFPAVSTMLHAFTGKVMRDRINPLLENLAKTYMTVAPLPKMLDILVKALGEDRLMIADKIPENLKHDHGYGEEDIPIVIPLENLASLHS